MWSASVFDTLNLPCRGSNTVSQFCNSNKEFTLTHIQHPVTMSFILLRKEIFKVVITGKVEPKMSFTQQNLHIWTTGK